MRWSGHVAWNIEMSNVYNILVRKPEGKELLARPGRKCEDNIRMDLKKIVWEGVDWMYLGENRSQWRAVVNTVINFWVP
jgi:hypothetical protein